MRGLIDLPDLLINLISECLLASDDTEKLRIAPPHYTHSDVIRELVCLIERKGENGLVKFMSALRKSASQGDQPGHQELLQLLEDDLAREPQPVPVPVPNTSERDLIHELGCQLFNTREYRALRRYDHNVRTFIRCLCAALLTYQFIAMMIVTLCEDSGFRAVLNVQESENRYTVALHCFLLIVLRVGTRVVTPVLFISQFDVPAATLQIPKSCLKEHEAIKKILQIFSPLHRQRIKAKQSDLSAAIDIAGKLIKRHIESSWIIVLHSLLFTWLLFDLGAFNMAVDRVMTRQGICNIHFLHRAAIQLPLVSNPVSLLVIGECVSILAILLLVGILKEFYLYENRVATYALKMGKEGEKIYNVLRKRWATLDRYCYATPPILSLLVGLTLLTGRGFTPEPSQEIEAIDVVNWYFWIAILSALTLLATSQNLDLKRASLFGYAVAGILLYIFKGAHLTIPAVSDCAVFLLYYCHAVVLLNFHASLVKCHYYHYMRINSAASIYHLGYCFLCIGLLVISLLLSVHWEVFNFGHFF